MEGIVRTLTSQDLEQESDMIKLSFKRIMLAIVWKMNKWSTHGSEEFGLEATAVIQQRHVCGWGQGGTRGEQGLDSRSSMMTEQ